MSLGPFLLNITPSVYGPINYPVKKIDERYSINGYGGQFEGTCQEIAEQIFLKLMKLPKQNPRNNYVLPFCVDLDPVRVLLVMNADRDPLDLDLTAIASEITESFERFVKLIVFS